MSGRALSKLGVAWQAAAYASDDGRLTEQMCIEICDDAVKDHRQKVSYKHCLDLIKILQKHWLSLGLIKIKNTLYGDCDSNVYIKALCYNIIRC